jgi:demethylmenaquinone methyltransferase/2-methoxy-6-polyprenyl-1,4-benzoquinol methylase
MTEQEKTTDFGFETVAWDDKEKKVSLVFNSVATRYDLMNDIMSFGIHRAWKKITVCLSQVRAGQHVLDLAGGSGDITRLISQRVGEHGHITMADINDSMLTLGRNRLIDQGLFKNISYVQANAEKLPFANNAFHCIIMAFGLRNVTDKQAALNAMQRVCKPGGKLMVLEFSKPTSAWLSHVYDAYSFHVLPKLGQLFAQDAPSYQYLAESIRMHPAQETLKEMIERAGFDHCEYRNLTGGVVALHIAHKY